MIDNSPENIKRLIEKWGKVLDYQTNPLSSQNVKAILIEPFTTWDQEFNCEFITNNKPKI